MMLVMERARSHSACMIYAAIALRLCHIQRARSKHVSLGNSCIERIHYRLTALSMFTARVVVLERSQLHKKAYNLVSLHFSWLRIYCFPHTLDVHASRPHQGQQMVAGRLRALLDSTIHPSEIRSERDTDTVIQAAHTDRAGPDYCHSCRITIMSSTFSSLECVQWNPSIRTPLN